jgi:PTS system mannose-specific IIA component
MSLSHEGSSRVGVVVVTHEGAAHCLLGAAQAILGSLPSLEAVNCSVGEPTESIIKKIAHACQVVDAGAGVLILVDLHGSTPFNAAMTMLDGTRDAEVLCGVNLPMLIKISTVDRRGVSPTDLAEVLQDIGKRSIRLGSELTGKVVLGGGRG